MNFRQNLELDNRMLSCIRKNKTLLSDLSLSLTHYDPKLDIIVASDASSYSIGACILHKLPDGTRKANAHASLSLLHDERQYSQIEKKALGLIFAATKFHRYFHVRQFVCCRFLVQKQVYRYTPPTDFYVGVPYY